MKGAPFVVSQDFISSFKHYKRSTNSISMLLTTGNNLDECYPKEDTRIEAIGFKNYMQFSWVFLLCIVGACVVLHLVARKVRNQADINFANQEVAKEREKRNALDSIGRDSVYRFLLSKNWFDWGMALVVLVLQLWLCYFFVVASEVTLDVNSDVQYMWRCPRDRDECITTDGMERMCLTISCPCSHTLCVCATS